MERKDAIAFGLSHYETGRKCKYGHVAKRRVSDRKCMACELSNKQKNPPTKEYKQVQYIKHRDNILKQKKEYRQKNHGQIIALATARKKRIKNQIPKWLTKEDLWVIKEIYLLAAIRTKMFGYSWHVDHIVPIKGTHVCGLHTPKNLQVIPWIDNIRKRNSYAI
jgi:hypothetical protein